MTVATVVDPRSGRLHTSMSQLISFAELEHHINAEADAGQLGLAELIDARDARTAVTPDQIRILVEQVRRRAKTGAIGPTALVTTDDVVFGMGRMYSILAESFDPRFQVFRDLESAERWLGAGAPRERGDL
jgi:hypothetical protein